jgi:hypothetical protein
MRRPGGTGDAAKLLLAHQIGVYHRHLRGSAAVAALARVTNFVAIESFNTSLSTPHPAHPCAMSKSLSLSKLWEFSVVQPEGASELPASRVCRPRRSSGNSRSDADADYAALSPQIWRMRSRETENW